MKTIKDVLNKWKFDWDSERFTFAEFLSYEQMKKFLGKDLFNSFKTEIIENFDKKKWKPFSFDREVILNVLKQHVSYGFKTALSNNPGFAPCYTYNIVRLFNWILEEGLEDWEENNYENYGLPLFKATAEKYGWDNPIGNDKGDEEKYSKNR